MASFLGAAANGVARVCLARGVPVLLNTTAAQVLCTPLQAYRVTQVVLTSGVTAGTSATAAFTVGYTAALASLLGTQTLTSMPSLTTTTGTYIGVNPSGSTAAVPGTGAAGATVYFSMTVVSTGATAATCDLYGELL